MVFLGFFGDHMRLIERQTGLNSYRFATNKFTFLSTNNLCTDI